MARVILERRYVPKNAIIIKEGDDAYSAYLIQSGKARVYSTKNDKQHELAILEPGDICGEMALINTNNMRSASVEAIEDCNLIVITRTAFEEKLKKSDPTIQAVVKMLINRILSSNEIRAGI